MLRKILASHPAVYGLCLLVLGFISTLAPAHAALVDDLYSVELPVPDQTTSQRLEVFRQAMREVIVKVSGSTDALSAPGLKRPLVSSARYVLQYRYFNRRDPLADAFDSGQLYLKVVFNQEALETLLREANVPVWGRERPSTLMLVILDVNREVVLVSADAAPDMLDELEQEAARMGLPVLFPLLDLEDRRVLNEVTAEPLEEDVIEALAERYVPDALLVGRLSGRIGSGWQGEWQVRMADRVYNWNFTGKTREDTIKNLMGRLAHTLATEYALQSNVAMDEDILLGVDRLARISDLSRVLAYLQSLDAVASARPVLINDERVTYRVSLRNSVQDLQQLIDLGSVLEQLDLPAVDATRDDNTVLLHYQLMR